MSTGTAVARSIDAKRYSRLLAKVVPKVIENEAENVAALQHVERLIKRGDQKRTPEENALLQLLVTLVEQFERNRYPVLPGEPRERLRFLMESNNLKPADLIEIVGARGRVYEILSGKRGISRELAKRLAERFSVSPELFL